MIEIQELIKVKLTTFEKNKFLFSNLFFFFFLNKKKN